MAAARRRTLARVHHATILPTAGTRTAGTRIAGSPTAGTRTAGLVR
ncbi:hypothetical protein [Sediminihabitans luteus]|nr:hypothetical protein [Sediminihabitans luteus]